MIKINMLKDIVKMVADDNARLAKPNAKKRVISLHTKQFIAEHLEKGELLPLEVADALGLPVANVENMLKQLDAGLYDHMSKEELMSRTHVKHNAGKQLAPVPVTEPVETPDQRVARLRAELAKAEQAVEEKIKQEEAEVTVMNNLTKAAIHVFSSYFKRIPAGELKTGQTFLLEVGKELVCTGESERGYVVCREAGCTRRKLILKGMLVIVGQ